MRDLKNESKQASTYLPKEIVNRDQNLDPKNFVPATPLGKRLLELRKKIIAAGDGISDEGVQQYMDEQRRRNLAIS